MTQGKFQVDRKRRKPTNSTIEGCGKERSEEVENQMKVS